MLNWWKEVLCGATALKGLRNAEAQPLVYIQSFDGHERERAIHELIANPDLKAIPLLVERLNDWVPQVRNAAWKAIEVYLLPEFRSYWLANAQHVLVLMRKTRVNHQDFLSQLNQFFEDEAAGPAIENAMASEAKIVRRFAFSLAFKNPAFDLEDLLTRILNSDDLGLRKEVKNRLDILSPELYTKLEPLGFNDRFPRTHTLFLQQTYKRQLPSLKPYATELLLDRSRSVRRAAIFFACEAGVDVAEFYRDVLVNSTNPKHQLWAAVALSEMGDDSILPQLLAMLESPEPRTIITGLSGLERLNQPDVDSLLRQYLKFGDIQVLRYCWKVMVRRKVKVSTAELLELHRTLTEQALPLTAVLRLDRVRAKWDSLNFLLKLLLQTSDPSAAQQIRDDLWNWFYYSNRSQQPLSDPLRLEIRDSLAALKPNALRKSFYEELEFLTRS